eukprot:SM000110S18874  [mRNA]  locus=s110:36236:38473:+ [translate_table: standard]
MTINVETVADIQSRTSIPKSQTVVLVLQNDLTVPRLFTFGAPFSCTILQSAPGAARNYRITTTSDTAAGILVSHVSHFLLLGVDIHAPIVEGTSPSTCGWKVYQHVQAGYCPALVVADSSYVQVVKCTIDAAIHLFRSTNSLIDHNIVSSLDFGITVGGTGGGSFTTTPMNHIISNNEIRGYVVGVNLAYGTVGVSVNNNYIWNFIFAGVSLGRGVHNVGDAMFNTVANNYIEIKNETAIIPDGAGIYTVLHWLNPGNSLKCNYVVGHAPHCLYLDFASSGVQIEGAVCYQTGNGLKINTGHNNNILGMLIVEPYGQPGFIAPQLNWNCVTAPGTDWEQQRKAHFSSPVFQAAYPWLSNFCKITEVNGFNCNAPGGLTAEQTGNCSGMPTGNLWESVVVAAKNKHNPELYFVNTLPALPFVNTIKYARFDGVDAPTVGKNNSLGFRDAANSDYGLKHNSAIYQTFPTFFSCPRAAVGPQPVDPSYYFSRL